MKYPIPPRHQAVTEICCVNSIAVQRYVGHDPRETPWSPWSAEPDHSVPVCEMVTIFDARGNKLDMPAHVFAVIVEKWIAACEADAPASPSGRHA